MNTSAGIEFHTFSIMGRCARTGMLGVAITTSDLCVGSRCPYVRSKVGAVSTQATTDPRLGPMALDLLEKGNSPEDAIKELEAGDPHIERRQIGVVGWNGKSSVRTGAQNLPWAGHIANENYVAMGNGLSSEKVVQSMAETFERLKTEMMPPAGELGIFKNQIVDQIEEVFSEGPDAGSTRAGGL